MKIFLTGQPRSGKSTLLERLIQSVDPKQGFITKEIRENDIRVGFELVDAKGNSATLAKAGIQSEYQVSRYGVDVESLDNFISPLFDYDKRQLLYIDEVGQMELFSDNFKSLVEKYLESNNHFVGTITSVYEDSFTKDIKRRPDLSIIEISAETRDEIFGSLNEVIRNLGLFDKLSTNQKEFVEEVAKNYIACGSFIQLRKLYKNAINYIVENKVSRGSDGHFSVVGNHNIHQVNFDKDKWNCDCDLFRGKGQFTDKQGECSHIQASKLLEVR